MSKPAVRRGGVKVRYPVCLAAWEILERRALLSGTAVGIPQVIVNASAHSDGTTTVPTTALTPAQIQAAYGVNGITLPNVSAANGAGQTIAIIDAYNNPNALSDLQAFDAKFGLANPPSFTQLNENGGTTLPAADSEKKPDTWELEESLDVEWAHAIAPGANIILFEAKSTSLSDLFTAVQTAKATAGVSVVSMSFGSNGDMSGETSYDSIFTSNAGQGVTFLGASGDSGGSTGFPAVSPNVIGVGGTNLTTNSAGAYLGETAWNGSSGGLSSIEAQPSYQKGIVTQSTTKRTGPDVAMDANPSTGVAVYDSFDGSATGGNWFQVGGTSLSTPMFSGLIAIADQGRVANGMPTYDGRTGTLPRLYSLPSSDFNDITSGSNSKYGAASGYDLVTGRGFPVANKLVPDLANIPTPSPTSPTPSPTSPTPSPTSPTPSPTSPTPSPTSPTPSPTSPTPSPTSPTPSPTSPTPSPTSPTPSPTSPTPSPTSPTPTAPVVASLTSSANPATVNRTFTITANGITDANDTVASVSFYYETNGKTGLQTGSGGDTLLATMTNGSNGWSINVTASAAGTYTLYATATGSDGLVSAPVSLTLTVQRANGSFGGQFSAVAASETPAPANSLLGRLPTHATTIFSALSAPVQNAFGALAADDGVSAAIAGTQTVQVYNAANDTVYAINVNNPVTGMKSLTIAVDESGNPAAHPSGDTLGNIFNNLAGDSFDSVGLGW